MEEYLASSLLAQKTCQTLFVYVSISGGLRWQPLVTVGSLETCVTESKEMKRTECKLFKLQRLDVEHSSLSHF